MAPWQIVWAAEMVLFVISVSAITDTAVDVSLQVPDVTNRLNQIFWKVAGGA